LDLLVKNLLKEETIDQDMLAQILGARSKPAEEELHRAVA
jgi:hypothetical protein